jgi:hypothetical protein
MYKVSEAKKKLFREYFFTLSLLLDRFILTLLMIFSFFCNKRE